jgi:hypothetical protein
MNLTKADYIKILDYYNVAFKNTSTSHVKKLAERIIAEKLCSCIKKVPNANNPESRAIGICIYSVLQRKHLKINGFSCKKKWRLNPARRINTNYLKILHNYYLKTKLLKK